MKNIRCHLVLVLFCAATLLNARAGGTSPAMPARSRVIEVEDAKATDSFIAQRDRVRVMLDKGLTALTGRKSISDSWKSLLAPQDIIGIKVYATPGPLTGTRPAVVEAVVTSLLEAGFAGHQILIWDKHLLDLRLAGFVALADRLGVRVAGSAEEGYDPRYSYDSSLLGKLVYGDFEFGQKGDQIGRKSYVSKLVTDKMTRIISIAPLINHNLAGVTGHLVSLTMGSVDNTLRFEGAPEALAVAVPEIYALPIFVDRAVLHITDALVAQYQGEERSLLHYSTPLNQLRLSTDPVALDVLSVGELDSQREKAQLPPVKYDRRLYENAALLELGVAQPRNIQIETVRIN